MGVRSTYKKDCAYSPVTEDSQGCTSFSFPLLLRRSLPGTAYWLFAANLRTYPGGRAEQSPFATYDSHNSPNSHTNIASTTFFRGASVSCYFTEADFIWCANYVGNSVKHTIGSHPLSTHRLSKHRSSRSTFLINSSAVLQAAAYYHLKYLLGFYLKSTVRKPFTCRVWSALHISPSNGPSAHSKQFGKVSCTNVYTYFRQQR